MEKPSRILMTADTVGGVWSYAVELIRALPEVQFALATMGSIITETQRDEVSCLPNVSLFPSSYALEWMDHPWEEVDRAGDWLLEIAREFKPEMVHLNGYAHAALPWKVPVLVVAHSCVLSWWSAVKKCEAPPLFDEYRRRVKAGLHSADLVIAPTRAMLDTLGENYGFYGAGRVVSNGRDAAEFRPAVKRQNIFAAGRIWDEAKNFATLAAVARRTPWPIEIAGDSADPNGRSVELENVRSLGKLSPAELRSRLASSAIYVLPARYEPFGLSALEAGLCECALVLGDIGSLREVWGDAAIFIDPCDHGALAAALNRLTNDEALRVKYSKRARARGEHFSATRTADAYRAVYHDCFGSSVVACAVPERTRQSRFGVGPLRTTDATARL